MECINSCTDICTQILCTYVLLVTCRRPPLLINRIVLKAQVRGMLVAFVALHKQKSEEKPISNSIKLSFSDKQ